MKHTSSLALFHEACALMPGGVNSPVRSFSSAHADCLFADHAYGSHIVDVDGNTYLDYIGSWGPMILGHAHPLLSRHLEEVIQKGISFGLCTAQEVELARLITDAYPGLAMVRMVNSGTEATMSAIRAARGFTGRDKIIKFEGCYHGHSDGLLVKSGSGALTFATPTSPGVPADVVKHTLVCSYNDLENVEAVIKANEQEIAAVPRSLPALIRTSKILKKMDRSYSVFQNEKDSCQEAEEALNCVMTSEDEKEVRQAAGNLLLQICNVLRLRNISAEEALTDALEKLLKMYEIPECP